MIHKQRSTIHYRDIACKDMKKIYPAIIINKDIDDYGRTYHITKSMKG